MSIEPLRGSNAISVRELADIRSAGKKHTVLDVREARELDVCRLEGALHVPMAEIPARATTSRRINCWWSFVITALAVKWLSIFFEAPALTTQSTSTAALMLGLATSTNQCRAIDSVGPKWRLRLCR
jgi:hypothetical protein